MISFGTQPGEFGRARQFVTLDGDQKIRFQVRVCDKQFVEVLPREEKQGGLFDSGDRCGAAAVFHQRLLAEIVARHQPDDHFLTLLLMWTDHVDLALEDDVKTFGFVAAFENGLTRGDFLLVELGGDLPELILLQAVEEVNLVDEINALL